MLLLGFTIGLMSCKSNQEDTCEHDKINGDWQRIIDSSECSSTEKAEAYLALGGFDYFGFIGEDNPDLISMLGLNEDNWQTKRGYFDSALSLVAGLSTGTQKTIYLFGAFLGMYTYFAGNLDNGANGQAIALDGNIESSETDAFTGSGLSSGSGTNETELITTSYYQVSINNSNQYYTIDSATLSSGPPYTVYEDNDADGTGDTLLAAGDATTVVNNMSSEGISALNQVVLMNRLQNPFQSIASVNINNINQFSNTVLDYLNKIETATDALELDDTEEPVKTISEYQSDIDNGGECQLLEENPALLLSHYFASSMQKTQIADYATVNVLLASKLSQYGVDATFDANDLSTSYGFSDMGVKVRYLNSDGSSYIPYWSDATSDITETMNVFSEFSVNVVAKDGTVSLAEIICASELLSKSE